MHFCTFERERFAEKMQGNAGKTTDDDDHHHDVDDDANFGLAAVASLL